MALNYDAIKPYESFIQNAAKQHGVSPDLIRNVIMRESSGNPTVASGTGPVGLGQISESLAKQYGYSLEDRLDPQKNIDMTARYLGENLKAFKGDERKALMGYSLGTQGAKNYYAGKQVQGATEDQYLGSPYLSQYKKGGGNPVGALSSNPQAPLKGEALMTATPQTEEQAINSATQPALMGADNLPDYKKARETEAERIQREQEENRKRQQQEYQNKLDQEQRNRDEIFSTALNGAASALGSIFKNNNVDTQSRVDFTHFYNPHWGTPTEQNLSTISQMGTMRNMLNQ